MKITKKDVGFIILFIFCFFYFSNKIDDLSEQVKNLKYSAEDASNFSNENNEKLTDLDSKLDDIDSKLDEIESNQ